MRTARTLWLLVAASFCVSSCATGNAVSPKAPNRFIYKSESGKVATFDINRGTLSSPDGEFSFRDCSTSEVWCYRSDSALIEVPKECPNDSSINDYIKSFARLRFLSLEGLSGTIYKVDMSKDKFGYGYNPKTGLVSFIVVPGESGINVSSAGPDNIPYIYRAEGYRGPFSCR